MIIWPRDTRRASLLMIVLLLLSGSISYAYIFMIEPATPPHEEALWVGIWRWATTALLSLLIVIAKHAYGAIKKQFEKLGDRMDGIASDIIGIKESQLDFALGITQMEMDLHPEKAVEISKHMNGLLKIRSHKAVEG